MLGPMASPQRPDIKSLLEQEEQRSAEPGKRHLRLATFLGPILVTLGLLVLVAVVAGVGVATDVVIWAIAIFTVLGKFAILAGVGGDAPFDQWQLATLVSYMDVTVASLLVFNLPRLYRIPRMGPAIEDLAEHGLYLLERNRWLGRVTFVGVVLFVMFPLTGTGAIGGSIFGRLLGLSSRRTLTAIVFGASAGSFGMAAFAGTIASIFPEEVRRSWQFQAVGGVVIVILAAVVWWRGKRLTAELRARREARAGEDGDASVA